MNRKAFELAISTLIIIAISVAVLIGLVYALTGGFKKFKSTTAPFLDTNEAAAVRQACSLACDAQNRYSFCCTKYRIEQEEIKCTDSRLEVSCAQLDCMGFRCANQQNHQIQTHIRYITVCGNEGPGCGQKVAAANKIIIITQNNLTIREVRTDENGLFETTLSTGTYCFVWGSSHKYEKCLDIIQDYTEEELLLSYNGPPVP